VRIIIHALGFCYGGGGGGNNNMSVNILTTNRWDGPLVQIRAGLLNVISLEGPTHADVLRGSTIERKHVHYKPEVQ